jgi:hypothetical protein
VSPLGSQAASSTATWLASALPSSASVVKSFNNLSAYTLLHGDTLTEHMKSVAASDDWDAAEATADFGRALGLEVCRVSSTPVDGVQHQYCCCLHYTHNAYPADANGKRAPAGINCR